MKRQGGFTLIELVVVIVILGILAVTAAPRFLNLQTDAKNAALQGLSGAMAGAAGIIYGKSAIEGEESSVGPHNVTEGGTTVVTSWGYPTATTAGIGEAVFGLDTDWMVVNNTSATTIAYTFVTDPVVTSATDCMVTYVLNTAVSNASPTITVTDCQ